MTAAQLQLMIMLTTLEREAGYASIQEKLLKFA
jgi:hypothetical protein